LPGCGRAGGLRVAREHHKQNAFAECFIGRLRDECLKRDAIFLKADYNTVWPHSSLGNLPPANLQNAAFP
jgi:transposase InsO family protein